MYYSTTANSEVFSGCLLSMHSTTQKTKDHIMVGIRLTPISPNSLMKSSRIVTQRMSASAEFDGDDDDELLLAASAWASAQDEGSGSNNEEDQDDDLSPPKKLKEKKEKVDAAGPTEYDNKNQAADVKNLYCSSPPQNNYSLHLKNVPYDASQGDIRFAFGEKGCNVTSVRLVYDRDQSTGERHFRGVAFVDLADEKSYKMGLEFHNKSFLGKGRRVNVRPTRTKSELSDIVRRTEEKVATLIARSKEVAQTKRGRDDDTSKTDDKESGSGRSKKKQKRKKQKEEESRDGVKKSDPTTAKSQSNGPEKKENTKKNSIENNNSADFDNKSDAPCPETQSNETRETTEETGKKKNERAKSKGKQITGSESKHDVPTTKPPNNHAQEASKGLHNKQHSRERADPNNMNNAPTMKPLRRNAEEGTKGAEKKGKKRSKSKDGKSPGKDADVKLTKKQRAKKAAVIRMLKFKG